MPRRRIADKLPDAFVLALVVVLTGCASHAPRPVEVSLDSRMLDVRLSDNSVCTAPVEAQRTASGRILVGGSGMLQDCAIPLSYRVSGDVGGNPIRIALEEVLAAIGLADAVAPAAEVRIAAADGQAWVFASPPR